MERDDRREVPHSRQAIGSPCRNAPSNGTRVPLRPSNRGPRQRMTEIQYFLRYFHKVKIKKVFFHVGLFTYT